MSEQSQNRLVVMKYSLSVFSPIATNITLYFYVSSTVKRKNQYTDFLIYMSETDYKLFIISCMKVIHSNFASILLQSLSLSSSIAQKLWCYE